MNTPQPDIAVVVSALIRSEIDAIEAGQDVKTSRKYGDRAADMLKHLNKLGWVVVPADQVKEYDEAH